MNFSYEKCDKELYIRLVVMNEAESTASYINLIWMP